MEGHGLVEQTLKTIDVFLDTVSLRCVGGNGSRGRGFFKSIRQGLDKVEDVGLKEVGLVDLLVALLLLGEAGRGLQVLSSRGDNVDPVLEAD